MWKNKPGQVDACLLTISCGGSVHCFAQLAGGRYVVAVDKAVEVRDARNGELLETLSEGGSDVNCVATCAAWICAGFADGTIKVWDCTLPPTPFSSFFFADPCLTIPRSCDAGAEEREAECL